jgi:hypothetical protein
LEVSLTPEQCRRIVEAAEGATKPGQDEVVGALVAICRRNETLEGLGVQIEASCTGSGDEEASDGGDEELKIPCERDEVVSLNSWETGLYLYRWPNGDVSVVKGFNRRDALVELDEWAVAHPAGLIPLDEFLVDFALDDAGRIKLHEFGECTEDFLREECYPELEAVFSRCGVRPALSDEYSPEVKEEVRKAVDHERNRLMDSQPEGPEAETEVGRLLQAQLGAAGPVADYWVELAARSALESFSDDGEKPN